MNCQFCAPMYLHISQQYTSNMPAPLIIYQTHLLFVFNYQTSNDFCLQVSQSLHVVWPLGSIRLRRLESRLTCSVLEEAESRRCGTATEGLGLLALWWKEGATHTHTTPQHANQATAKQQPSQWNTHRKGLGILTPSQPWWLHRAKLSPNNLFFHQTSFICWLAHHYCIFCAFSKFIADTTLGHVSLSVVTSHEEINQLQGLQWSRHSLYSRPLKTFLK